MTADQSAAEPAEAAARSGSPLYRIATVLTRRRRTVFAVWVALIVAGFAFTPKFVASLSMTGLRVPGSESTQAAERLARDLPAAGGNQAVLVFASGTLTADSPAFQAVIAAAAANVGAVSGISGVELPVGPASHQLVSIDGHSALAVVAFATGDEGKAEQLTPKVVAAAQKAASAEVSVGVTGEPPLARDLLATLNVDLLRSEAVGLPAALIVLFIVFGGLVAAGLPLLLAVASLGVTLGGFGAVELIAGGGLNMLLESSTEALALGIGIDYALFIVTRFREELARGADPARAAAAACATAGRTVLVSGMTVVIALAPVLLVDDPMMREVVLGPMVAITMLMLAALTLLPAVLAGPWALRLAPSSAARRWTAPARLGAKVTRVLVRRPLTVLVAVVVPLLALSAVTLRLHTGLDYGLPAVKNRPAGQAAAAVAAAFGPGAISPIQLVVATDGRPLTAADLGAVAALDAAVAADPRVASVASLPGLLGGVPAAVQAIRAAGTDPAAAAALPPLVDAGRGAAVTVVAVLPRASFDSAESARLVKDLRTLARDRMRGTGLSVLVGGATAAVVDFTDEINAKTPLVLFLVVALALLVLAAAFGSAVVALVGLIGTLLSVGAAYGALVLVFQEGAGESVLGFTSPGFIQSWLPLLLFATLTGLSTDYQVFLVSRVKEERDAGVDAPEAVAAGLRRSGPVILAAAAIMIVVFAAFLSADELEIKEMGFALAAVVLIDAAVVRRLMVPAALLLLGARVWRQRGRRRGPRVPNQGPGRSSTRSDAG